MSLAETMLAGGDFLSDLDQQRKDAAGLALRAVPEVPAATAVIGTWTIVRRVEVRRGELAGDIRSRRRRTIDPGHPILLEVGEVEVAYAYSFIMTNVSGGICKIEAWFEVRGPRRGDAEGWKRGGGALPLPVGEVRGQRRLGAVRHPRSQPLAMAGDARGRPDGFLVAKTVRRQLLSLPGRLTTSGRRHALRLPARWPRYGWPASSACGGSRSSPERLCPKRPAQAQSPPARAARPRDRRSGRTRPEPGGTTSGTESPRANVVSTEGRAIEHRVRRVPCSVESLDPRIGGAPIPRSPHRSHPHELVSEPAPLGVRGRVHATTWR